MEMERLPPPRSDVMSVSCDKAMDRQNIFGQIQMPTLPRTFKAPFKRSSRSLGATICIPLVAAAKLSVAGADVDVNRGYESSQDRQLGSPLSAKGCRSGNTSGSRSTSCSSSSRSSEMQGGSTPVECAPAVKPSRFSMPTMPKMPRSRRSARRPQSAGRYVKVSPRSAKPQTPACSSPLAPGTRSSSCSSRTASWHTQATTAQVSACASPQDSVCLTKHQHARTRMSPGFSNIPSSGICPDMYSSQARPDCRSPCDQKSKLEFDDALAVKALTAALDAAALQQSVGFDRGPHMNRAFVVSSDSSGLSFLAETDSSDGRRGCRSQQHNRKSKLALDPTMAAKYLKKALDDVTLQQPTGFANDARTRRSSGSSASSSPGAVAEAASSHGHPSCRAPCQPERTLEVDDFMFELGFDFDFDLGPKDLPEMDQLKSEGACHYGRIDLDFSF